jgi:polyisoprenyl-phosphate glycosyltransferase
VYQGAESLSQLHAELTAGLEAVTADWMVVYVDDGSTDGSWETIRTIALADARVVGLQLIRNFGEHVAITAGLDVVDADHVVIIACDLQDDPAAIPDLVRLAQEGADLVLVRRMRRRDPLTKRLLARLFYALVGLLVGVRYDYRVGNYRLLTRSAVDYFRTFRERSRNVSAIMTLMGVRTSYLDVAHRPRRHSRSSYSFWRSLKLAADVVLDYSHIPLLFSAAAGSLLLLQTLVAGLLVIAFGWDAVQPWGISTTTLAMALIGGLVLVNLGIVGAYLGRSATEARGRPLYFVEQRVGIKAEHSVTRMR